MSYPNQNENENQDKQFSESEAVAAAAAQKEQILKQILSADAKLRLNNVKMVKPDLANLVETYLIGMARKISSRISDEQLKQILLSLQQPKHNFKITRR